VSRPFEIGITLVTQALWRAVMDSSPSFFKTEDRPADNISYDDVQAFLARLSTFGLTGFRLTTEAEWGWAARCGAPTRWSGADRAKLVAVAGARRTEPVAVLYPDSAGIFDQSGNVMEWVADWHQGSPEPGLDQRGPASGPYRVNRGGNWCSDLNFARVAARSRNFPASRNDGLFGFRLLRITP
jgi:formylglycine-generating enzyme required for sulfatase activity